VTLCSRWLLLGEQISCVVDDGVERLSAQYHKDAYLNEMLLYHFTARSRLAPILRDGLRYGDVAINRRDGFQAVWLTSDDDLSDHGLDHVDNKRAIRISVDVPHDHPNLHRWIEVAPRFAKIGLVRALIRSGGGKTKAGTWFIFLGVFGAGQFIEVVDMITRSRVAQEELQKIAVTGPFPAVTYPPSFVVVDPPSCLIRHKLRQP
jgi:hypothetical protein